MSTNHVMLKLADCDYE